MTAPRRPALLLLGPTGSGKTPVGQQIEARGLSGRCFVHFDFGQNLRDAVERGLPDEIVTSEDIEFLRGVLASGRLLEDEHFPLAQRILRSFLARRCVDADTSIVLNGLPRHEGQAAAVDRILDVRQVVCLDCSTEIVLQRLATNIGGDRDQRIDDDPVGVRKKLRLFHERTTPLVDHYREQGVSMVTIGVTATMTAEEAWNAVAAASTERL